VPLDPVYDERAIYTVAGEVEIAGDIFGPAQLLVFRPGDRITIRANTDARFMALGGEPMGRPPAHLVEFRIFKERSHRTGQS
jgi:redox-sensitive bicupin YhaK (pirin superfamily)